MTALHYTETGHGHPLILLHSGGMSGEEWKPQIQAFAKHFHVIVPDQPGHGSSPLLAERLKIGDIGRAVIDLMDDIGLKQAYLVGSSMGGAVALWLTLTHPERVAKLVIYRVGYQKNDQTHAGTLKMADPNYWRGAGLERWLSRIHAPQGGPDAWQRVIGRVAESLEPATSDHAHDPETLRHIEQPTLIVVGDRDPLVPLEQVLEMFHAIPDAGLWVMPHATHVTASNTWRSESFGLEVSRFLLRHS